MAAIVNAADTILQATSPRMAAAVTLPSGVIVPATRSILLTSTSPVFAVTPAGVASPSSITLTATNVAITGSISWSVVSGSATLTSTTSASPASATLQYSDMVSAQVTVRATCVDSVSGNTYTSDYTITRLASGARSGYGPTYGISSSTWSDAQANAVIYNMAYGTSLTSQASTAANVLGDTVVLSNSSTYTQSKTWNGSAWVSPTQYYDGAFIANASVNTLSIAGNAVTVPVTYSNTPNQVSDGFTTYSYTFTVTTSQPGTLFVSVVLQQAISASNPDANWATNLLIDGVSVFSNPVPVRGQTLLPLSGSLAVGAGTHTIEVRWLYTVASGATLMAISGYAVAAKR